jgi:16S rRNA (cytosine1402-N4)-methyltransferase
MLTTESRHIPVMLGEVLPALSPRDSGVYVDGTFGAGGYTQAILSAANCRVYAIDRDPQAISAGRALEAAYPDRLTLCAGRMSEMEALLGALGVTAIDGAVFDVGVSSMQIDQAERGFSFAKDGPLDMRMSQEGPSAADAVNSLELDRLTRVISLLGEEHKARAIAKAIIKSREIAPLQTTQALVTAVERATGKQKAHERIHPATRTFQALRIYVNAELDELALALAAAERLLKPGGRLVVVTFHSLEDRIVKRFFAERSKLRRTASRHLPQAEEGPAPSFELLFKGHVEVGAAEAEANPRARSAKLRAGIRTDAPAHRLDIEALGVPRISEVRH